MKKRIIALLISLAMVVSLISYVSAGAPDDGEFATNSVILLIGSGMSTNHIKAAEAKLGRQLNISSMEYGGLLTTTAARDMTPDNASAASALATGQITNKYYISVGVDDVADESITEAVKKNGKKVGIISDKNLNDATTAAFSSHVTMKADLHTIAKQQINSGLDLFMGGGSYYYDKYSNLMSASGYKYIKSSQLLNGLSADDGKVFAAFANFSLTSSSPSLSDMLLKATEMLDNDNGFLVVAEGSGINTYSLKKNMSSMVSEMAKFDEAVGAAMRYVDVHSDTMLVVCGDCEAGDLTLSSNPTSSNVNNSSFKSDSYTKKEVPYYVYGKNASVYKGDGPSTCIPSIIAGAMGIYNFADDGAAYSEAKDYLSVAANSFSKWNFTNIRKNSTVAGITLATTSSNNAAVTVNCNKGAYLAIMPNAKIGFDLTVKSPQVSPFIVDGNADLSGYEGFVVRFGSVPQKYTLSVGRDGGDAPFMSSVSITPDMVNEYGDILLPFDSFEPAITADMANGMNVFEIAAEANPEKITTVVYGIDVYKTDDCLNYYQAIASAYSCDACAYTEASYNDMREKLATAKEAVNYTDRINAKHELLSAIDSLVSMDITYRPIDIAGIDITAQSARIIKEAGSLKMQCGLANPTVAMEGSFGTGIYHGIRMKISADNYMATSSDDFTVVFKADHPDNTITVNRPLMKDGYYYFAFEADCSRLSSVTIAFSGFKPGAVINMSDFEFFKFDGNSGEYATQALSEKIIKTAAGFEGVLSVEEGDINKDGVVNVCDALELIRK